MNHVLSIIFAPFGNLDRSTGVHGNLIVTADDDYDSDDDDSFLIVTADDDYDSDDDDSFHPSDNDDDDSFHSSENDDESNDDTSDDDDTRPDNEAAAAADQDLIDEVDEDECQDEYQNEDQNEADADEYENESCEDDEDLSEGASENENDVDDVDKNHDDDDVNSNPIKTKKSVSFGDTEVIDAKYGARSGKYELRTKRPRDYSHLHATLESIVMTQHSIKKG